MKPWPALLLALVASSALAQDGLGGRATNSFNLSPITAAEARAALGAARAGGAAVGSAIVRNLPRAARIVSWAGAISLAPEVMKAVLDWAYDEAKIQSGSPELDAWRTSKGGPDSGLVMPVTNGPTTSSTFGGPAGDYFRVQHSMVSDTDFYIDKRVCGDTFNTDGPFNAAQVQYYFNQTRTQSQVCGPRVTPTAYDTPEGAAAAAGLANIANKYLVAHPERVQGSISFSPIPTANQVAGAIIDPTIDSNGDGIPDGLAGAAGVDAGDPDVHPSLAPKVTTVTNPDGSVTKTTTTYDLNGTPHVTTIVFTPGSSAVTSTVTNSNGSVTTTTVTTTVNPNGSKDTVTAKDTVTTTITTSETATSISTNTNTQTVTEKSAEHIDEAGNKTTVTDPVTTVAKDAVKDVPKDTVCAADQVKGTDGTCAPRSSSNPGDTCGDFSLARTLAHPASVLRDVFLPCVPLKELIAPALGQLKTKFPFSLAASLNGWFTPAGAAGSPTVMPTSLGPIPLDFGWLAGLWGLIKTLVGIALWTWFVYWLIDRFTPRPGI